MKKRISALLPLMAALTTIAAARAQQPAAPNLDAIPEKAPFATPYGPPITARRAQALVDAAVAEAEKKGWPMNIAVVDSGANLLAFLRMDGALLGSIAIAQHKAIAAATFRRPTRVLEDAVQKADFKYLLSVDGVIAARGGIPLTEDSKIIGAIGCSGGTGSQDEAVCAAAVSAVMK